MVERWVADQPFQTGFDGKGNRYPKAYFHPLSRWAARISFKKILQNDTNLSLIDESLSLKGTSTKL
jgi:hypothetical protein